MPKGFETGVPAGFTLYQDKTSDSGGHTRRCANATAWKAAHAGQPLPDGSHIVAVATDKTGAITGYETMESRPGWDAAIPPLLRNANWNYGRFDKTGAPVANLNQAPCLACHKSKAADSYMFSHAELVGAKGWGLYFKGYRPLKAHEV